MNEFKEVLNIEKKYSKTISSANSKSELKLKTYSDELKLKEEATKQDYQSELNKDLLSEIEKQEVAGKNKLSKAQDDAKQIIDTADISKASDYLVEAFKNEF